MALLCMLATSCDPWLVDRVGSFAVFLFVLVASCAEATAQEKATLKFHEGGVQQLAFSPNGSILVSTSSDATTVLWNLSTLRKRLVLRHDDHIMWSVTFSPDGKLLATGGTDMPEDNKPVAVVRLWELGTGQEVATLRGEPLTNPVSSVAFSPDGRVIAAGSQSPGLKRFGPNMKDADNGEVQLWELATRRVRLTLALHAGPVYGVAFSPDGKTLAAVGGDLQSRIGELRLWDLQPGKLKVKIVSRAAPFRAVAFSPDGKILVTGAGDRANPLEQEVENVTELKLWEVASGKEIASLKGHRGPVYAVAFSPDGTILASAGGDLGKRLGELKLWDVATRKELASLEGHRDELRAVAFSPDGKLLASGGYDKTVKLWDVQKILGQKRKKR